MDVGAESMTRESMVSSSVTAFLRSARFTGAELTTLIHALRSRGGKYGMQIMCESAGKANVTILEAL